MVLPYIFLFLNIFLGTDGVAGAKLVFVNNCSEIIWPAISEQPKLSGLEIHPGNSAVVQAPAAGWSGRLWGRTGCKFGPSGNGSCITGDCGSGQLECDVGPSATTIVELSLEVSIDLDLFDVSLISGFNLPLVVKPSGGSGNYCKSTGCAKDLNQICPSESRIQGGRACRRDDCAVAGCIKPTNYSRLLKKACPNAYIVNGDPTFSCSGGTDYFITFCPLSLAQTTKWMPPAKSPAYSPPPTTNGMPPAQSPTSSPVPKTNGKNHFKVIIIVVALIIGCVIIAFIMVLCFLKRCHSISVRPNKENKHHIEKFLLQHGSMAPKRYRYSEIKKITKSFSVKLGKGGYGSVYKGALPDGSLVAIKDLMETDSNGEEFINEVASISRTSHVNVVTLLGFCYEGKRRALIYEFMPNKSLDTFLKNNGSIDNADCAIDFEKLYEISVGIAKGLEYLHTGCNTRIVHFDIKPQNILLDEDFCPKIADFGLAKLCKKKQSVLSILGTRGTVGYIAPEVFSRTFGGVSHKSDVYSYGMMVLEMTGAKNVGEANTSQSSENYFPDKIYEYAILGTTSNVDGFMIEDAQETTKKMFLVGFWCIQTNPSDRPPMSKVVEMLEGSIQSIQIPPKPVLFTPTLPQQIFSSSLSEHIETENSTEIIAID